MSGKVLVGYATRTGSTVGVAEAIAETLAERGFAVDVRPLRENPSTDGYDAVVLGSAVNGGAWLPEALTFVENNAAALGKIPVAAFCVHIMNAGGDAKSTRKRLAYLDKVRTVVKPVDEGFFLGKGPTAQDTSLVMRWAFRTFGGSGEGDCRDWDTIRGWATKVPV
jgi:menaquinone-dependent protoporphyrinogen oxidase